MYCCHAQEESCCKDRYGRSACKTDTQADINLGDRIIVVVQEQKKFGENVSGQGAGIANKVRRGDIRHAVVVRAKKELQRKDGNVIRFDDNACVLINKSGDPIGTRLTGMLECPRDLNFTMLIHLTGVVGAELRERKWSKILSLAPMNV